MRTESVNAGNLKAYRDFIPAELMTGAISGDYRILGDRVFEEECGALVWKKEKGTDRGFLKSIYVDPVYRRIGAGEALLSALREQAGKEGVCKAVYSFSPSGDSRMLIPFFEDMNIHTEVYLFPYAEHTLGEMTPALAKKKIGSADTSAPEISTLDRMKRNILRNWLSDNFNEPLSSYMTPDVPCFAVIGIDTVEAALLMSRDGDALTLDYLYQRGSDGRILAGLLSGAVSRYAALYPPDTTIGMILTTDEACALHDALFGEARDRIEVCRGEILL